MINYGNGVFVRVAQRGDIDPIANNLCWGDSIEALALATSNHGMLKSSFEESVEAHTIVLNGTPISMFGVVKHDLMSGDAIFWILSSEEIYRVSRKLLKNSKKFIDIWLQDNDRLYNYIHADNTRALRWAKFLGAKLELVPKYGVNGEDFYRFTFTKKKDELTIKNTFNAVDVPARHRIKMFEELLNSHPQAIRAGDPNEPPLQHDFTDGMYTRTISIPKGMILTGKIHRHDHPNFLMSGKVEVFTEDEGLQTLEAPMVIMSKSGTKRVVYALEDTVWSTVHLNPTNTRDLKVLEENIIAKTYDDLDENLIDQNGRIT